MYDVIIVGGGIIGSSIAWQLSKKNQKVLVLERNDSASGSAGATDGVVGYHTKKPGVQLDLAVQSIEMFRHLQEELGPEIDIEFEEDCGGMQPVENQEQWDLLAGIVEEQRKSGVDIHMISAEEACKLEPNLAKDIMGALYCAKSCGVNPINLTFAYRKAAEKLGAEYKNSAAVAEFLIEGGRCVGVKTAAGEEFRAPVVVNSCGSWAGKVAALAGLDMPIKPRKGQLAITEPIGKYMTAMLQCANYNVIKFLPESIKDQTILKLGASLSIAQTKDGGVEIGATREFVGYEEENTFEAIDTMMKRAARFFPALKDVSVIRFFSGFRPYTPDGLPLLGEVKTLPGFYMAAGHEGDGIAMSPITGKLIAEMIVDGKPSYNIDAFSPNRFLK